MVTLIKSKLSYLLFFIITLLIASSIAEVSAATYPQGFSESVFVSGLDTPTSMTFSPDGRLFVTEKDGALRVIKNGQLLPTPFVTVQTDTYIERGLLGVAFDPDFATNRYIYVYYTRQTEPIKNRVSRFKASTTNPDLAEANSEEILLDDIPSDAGMHNAGAIHFGIDKKLYIAVGDGGQTATNAQSKTNLSGKILRINADGSIPTDNPFVGQEGVKGEIWTYGLRNPFTFAIHPASGIMMINDVGANIWEEVNLGSKGANFGWPTCEGSCSNAEFVNPIYQMYHPQMASITGASFYTGNNYPTEYKNFYFFGDYVKNFIKKLDYTNGNVVTDFATDTPSPVDIDEGIDGNLYYLSIGNGAVYKINSGTTTPSPTPVPNDGNGLRGTYFDNPNFTGNSVERIDQNINFEWGQAAPISGIDSDTFSVRWHGEISPQYTETYTFYTQTDDGVRLWVNNVLLIDNWIDQSLTEKQASIALVAGQKYDIQIEYYDGAVDATVKLLWSSSSLAKQTVPQSQLFYTSNKNPVASISKPPAGTIFKSGETITYEGSATDTEDDTLPASAYKWTVALHHDTHSHPFLGPINGVKNGSFQIPQTGESASTIWYRIHLMVTDSDGSTYSTFRDIYPQTAEVTLETFPQGLQINLDGQPHTSPYTFQGVSGFTRILNAPSPQNVNGNTYEFVSWSDGGTQNHTIQTPDDNTTLRANFRQIFASGNGLLGTYFDKTNFTGLTVQRTDPNIDFNWGTNSPASGIQPDYYSVRWTGEISIPQTNNYTFYTTTDDGVKLWIDDKLVIDKWQPQSATEHQGQITLTEGKRYKIRMDYYNSPLSGVAKLSWSSSSMPKQIIPKDALFSNHELVGDGLSGKYFNNINFTGNSIEKVDSTVSFDWEQDAPAISIAPDTFSIRWSGFIIPQYTENYTFSTITDDGVRLKINDTQIIDYFADQSPTERQGSIQLYGGVKYPIVMEYYENGWGAVSKLQWSSASQAKQIIPQDKLFSW